MKKILLPFSLGLLIAGSASAQITLSQSSFASANTSGVDTLLGTATNPTYPALTADAGANLDFTAATSSSNVSYLYRVAATAGSQWADSATLSFSGLAYKAKLESSLTSSGYFENGEHIDRIAYPTSLLVGIALPTDSVVIKGQDILFTAPRERLAFPANLHSSWTSSYNYDFNFTVSLTALSMSNTPGTVRAYVTEKDSVIGYGKVSVKTANGSGSAYLDVLQIQSMVTTTDSFFLAGSAASSATVTQLTNGAASQGQIIVTKEQYFYRAGELSPLVHISYDATNTTPTSAQTQAARLPAFIKETEYTKTLNVYPNPVTNHTILVSGAPANYGNWSYELENVTGQVVTKGALQLNTNNEKTQVNLSNTIVPGTYFLHMYNAGAAQETVRTLTIK